MLKEIYLRFYLSPEYKLQEDEFKEESMKDEEEFRILDWVLQLLLLLLQLLPALWFFYSVLFWIEDRETHMDQWKLTEQLKNSCI